MHCRTISDNHVQLIAVTLCCLSACCVIITYTLMLVTIPSQHLVGAAIGNSHENIQTWQELTPKDQAKRLRVGVTIIYFAILICMLSLLT